jgi:hypothetical protein
MGFARALPILRRYPALPIHNVKQRRALFPSRVRREGYAISFSRCALASEVCFTLQESPSKRPNKMKGAERRKARTNWPCPARATRTNVAIRPRFRRAHLSALHRGTRRAGRIRTSAQRSVPRFPRPGFAGRYPTTLSQSTALRGDRS